MIARVRDIENALSEIKCYNQRKSEISKESCELIIEALEIQIPKHPKHIHSYENADADGNRGIWMDWDDCPNCGTELENNYDDCKHCEQKIDWEEPEEDYWEY